MDEEKEKLSPEEEELSEEPHISGPLGVVFPADPSVWREARKLVVDRNTRVEDLATVMAQDPVLVIELLKVSNAMYFSGGRSAITTVRTALVRLGYDVVKDLLEKVKMRPYFTDHTVAKWFEVKRSKGKRAGIVSRIIAEAVARTLSDDCLAAGSLLYVGEMIAVAHLKEEYIELAEKYSTSGVNYRLIQQHNFDPEKMGLAYLRRIGLPENILFAIDREARARSAERAIMKPVVMAAGEMIEAFDNNRWEKLAPGKNLPPKSSIRMLQLNEKQYLKVYERAAEYLFYAKVKEEELKEERKKIIQEDSNETASISPQSEENELEDEINMLLKAPPAQEEVGEQERFEEKLPPEPPLEELRAESKKEEKTEATQIKTLEEELNLDDFNLSSRSPEKQKTPREEREVKVEAKANLRTKKSTQFVNQVTELFEQAQNSEELLSELLERLTKGPFEKAALIVVSKDKKSALVVAARGTEFGAGQRIWLNDPLSPLAQCFSKVQSFGIRENEASPFGSKSFALAPIDVDHETPVALYADCGEKGAITFEARRIFRTVVEILNKKLPTLPGGLPVELNNP